MKYINLCYVKFIPHSSLLPNELEKEVSDSHHIPPVYAHFLRFLCFYHLKKENQCIDVKRQLLKIIQQLYFIGDKVDLAASFTCAGIVFQLLRDYDVARHYYMTAVQ